MERVKAVPVLKDKASERLQESFKENWNIPSDGEGFFEE